MCRVLEAVFPSVAGQVILGLKGEDGQLFTISELCYTPDLVPSSANIIVRGG